MMNIYILRISCGNQMRLKSRFLSIVAYEVPSREMLMYIFSYDGIKLKTMPHILILHELAWHLVS